MGRTIIQSIGPLYGEAVNGTVYGRPNGSIYIPDTNQISILNPDELKFVMNRTYWGVSPYNMVISSDGDFNNQVAPHIVAKSQDTAAYIITEVSDTNDFTGDVASRSYTAGLFNLDSFPTVAYSNLFTIVDETTYYLRASLVSASGVVVAVSDIIEVTGAVQS